jgi:hypothetical protein
LPASKALEIVMDMVTLRNWIGWFGGLIVRRTRTRKPSRLTGAVHVTKLGAWLTPFHR